MNSTVEAALVSALFGIVGGLGSVWFLQWLRRGEIKTNVAKTKQDMEQTTLNMEQTRLEIEQMRSNMQAVVSYQRANLDVTTIYDGRQGFSGFDFVANPWAGAEGRIVLLDDDLKDGILSLERTNAEGTMRLELKCYQINGSTATMLPPGQPGATRKLRAELEARTLGAEHTILLVIKDPKSGRGEHLGEWRERLVSENWTSIEAYFEFTAAGAALFRIDDRSVSHAPSSLQVRRLVLAEKRS
jgi:hypothetical protein